MRLVNAGRRLLVHVFIALFTLSTSAWAETLTLAWDPSPDGEVRGYRVHVGTSSGDYSGTFDVGSATSFRFTSAAIGQPYFFAVSSYNASGLIGPLSREVMGLLAFPVTAPEAGATLPSDSVPPSDAVLPQEPALPSGVLPQEPALPSGAASSQRDSTPPALIITTSSGSLRYPATNGHVMFGGTAKDDSGIASVSWRNARGAQGRATGTETWVAGVLLEPGRNDITITATDSAGNQSSATISIVSRPVPACTPRTTLKYKTVDC